MIRSSDYMNQVNRHLASATYLLDSLNALPPTPNDWQKIALCESAALQLYFAFRTYLNELISYYSKNFLPNDQIMLGELLASTSGQFSQVTEFEELRQLLLSSAQPWRILCDLPIWLADTEQQKALTATPSQIAGSAVQSEAVNTKLIAVNERSDQQQILDSSCIRSMIKTLGELMERQRDNQVES